MKPMWKLPSPTWPTMAPITDAFSRSLAVSEMHSASREIGTQTSVARPCPFGLSAFTA